MCDTKKEVGEAWACLRIPCHRGWQRTSRGFLALFPWRCFCWLHASPMHLMVPVLWFPTALLQGPSVEGSWGLGQELASILHLIQCPQAFNVHGKTFTRSLVCPSLLVALNFKKVIKEVMLMNWNFCSALWPVPVFWNYTNTSLCIAAYKYCLTSHSK